MSKSMQIIDHGTGNLQQDCVLLLGYFDGVHIGHRKLIAKAKAIAAERGCLVGITTFYDSKKGRQIYTFAERVCLFEQLGIDFVYAAAFDGRFRATEGDDFLRHVCERLSVRAFVCGADYTYGKDAAGNTGTLRAFCKDRGIPLYVEELVNFSGEKAASAQAKRYLDAGDVQGLARLLGAPYFICGTVSTEGRQVGRKLGFPTANIHLAAEKYPLQSGVYAVHLPIEGKIYRGIANYGPRPTFGDDRVVLEIFADGYHGDLYGKQLCVYFDARIRGVRKFGDAAQLQRQLEKDLESIR